MFVREISPGLSYFVKIIFPLSSCIFIVSQFCIFHSIICSASSSKRCFWIALFNGLAPNCGSRHLFAMRSNALAEISSVIFFSFLSILLISSI